LFAKAVCDPSFPLSEEVGNESIDSLIRDSASLCGFCMLGNLLVTDNPPDVPLSIHFDFREISLGVKLPSVFGMVLRPCELSEMNENSILALKRF
jgi:hypothetical protein